jgi:di/tricarboxylate transporter
LEALTGDMVLVLAILAVTIALFVTEVVRIDVAAILVMVVVGLTGLVPAGDVFAGFSSNAVISIIAVMILGAGLDRVGVMRDVAAFLLRVGGETERRVRLSISAAVGLISAFMQNIGAAALFLPVAERVAERTGLVVSRLLMPMGFAAILGGTLTLVASGPLILLNDLLASSADNLGVDIAPYGLFAPTPVGMALLAAGLALFAVAGRWLLPQVPAEREHAAALPDIASTYALDRRMRPLRVPAGSSLTRHDVESVEAASPGVLVAAVSDAEGVTVAPPREEVLADGAVIGLVGEDDAVDDFVDRHGLERVGQDPFDSLRDESQAGMAEVVVRPGGRAAGQRVRDLRLRKRFGVTLLAVHHRGEVVTEGLRERQLAAGDVLIVFAPWHRLGAMEEDRSFVVLSDHPVDPPRTEKRWWALGAFAVALALVILTDLQLSLALMVGAVGVMVSGVLTADEAYRSVSWKTVFLLAALIPLGQAVEDTGTAAWIAEGVIGAAGGLPTWGVQLTVAVLATVFTLVVSNVGATVLLVPLAANVAVGVGADPGQFGLIVALAASNAFLLPTHQVNALLMGPGGYRVADYLRAGLAMSVLFLAVLIPAVNLLT